MDEAIASAYEGVKKISFEKAHYRTDIGRTLG
jgi:phosphoribosylamine-glycine ligase